MFKTSTGAATPEGNRESIRMSSKKWYNGGLFVFDVSAALAVQAVGAELTAPFRSSRLLTCRLAVASGRRYGVYLPLNRGLLAEKSTSSRECTRE